MYPANLMNGEELLSRTRVSNDHYTIYLRGKIMKRNRFFILGLLGILLLFSASLGMAQNETPLPETSVDTPGETPEGIPVPTAEDPEPMLPEPIPEPEVPAPEPEPEPDANAFDPNKNTIAFIPLKNVTQNEDYEFLCTTILWMPSAPY